MYRVVSLLAAAALAASPALAQVSSEAPPEDTAPPPAASVAVETPAPPPAADPAPEAAPAPETAPEPQVAVDPNVYQVLRAGDRSMSCDQLIAETNGLNASIMAAQQKASKGKAGSKFARGVAGGTTAGAMKTAGRFGLSRMAGSFGPMGALVAMAATDAVADSTGAAIANGGGADTAQPQVTPEQQRMNHLLSLYREKGC